MNDTLNQIEQIRKNGVGFRMPIGSPHSKFTEQAANSMIGKTTKMNAKEFGLDETWTMRIVEAKVVDDGQAIDIILVPVAE